MERDRNGASAPEAAFSVVLFSWRSAADETRGPWLKPSRCRCIQEPEGSCSLHDARLLGRICGCGLGGQRLQIADEFIDGITGIFIPGFFAHELLYGFLNPMQHNVCFRIQKQELEVILAGSTAE